MPTDPSVLDDEAYTTALRGFRAADERLSEARRAVTIAKDELAVALHHAAAPYRHDRLPVPPDVIEHLYWDRTELRVRDVATAFGITVHQLKVIAGPRAVGSSCHRCGAPVRVLRRSRSDGLGSATCGPCGSVDLHGGPVWYDEVPPPPEPNDDLGFEAFDRPDLGSWPSHR
jgi:hypothetical protein